MKIFKTISFLFIIGLITLNSCNRKGCANDLAENFSEKAKKDDGTCVYDTLYKVPNTYSFARSGNNTVSFSGQTQRLNMLSEMVIYMKSANTAGTTLSFSNIKAMYANENYKWSDKDNLGLTGSSKQLQNKTGYAIAGGSTDIGLQNLFISYLDSLTSISSRTILGEENGSAGNSGIWPNDGVKGPYLMGANGYEYTQLIEKGLMCAVFLNQITVNYLGGIAAVDNTVITDEENGKYYTKMEHHWDEAFGYFTSSINYPIEGTDRFWGKYAEGRELILGSSSIIFNAFITGRTAIINIDNVLRDQQVTIIRDELEKVCAASAIHYLNAAKTNIINNTARNHSLSEAYAFLNGLKYGYNSINAVGMTDSDITKALTYFETDFNTVTLNDIQSAIDLIASKTGLTGVKSNL